MSFQQSLNDQAIETLPKIAELLKTCKGSFEHNQIYSYTIRECLNCTPAIAFMTEKQKDHFQTTLIETFKYKEWLDN